MVRQSGRASYAAGRTDGMQVEKTAEALREDYHVIAMDQHRQQRLRRVVGEHLGGAQHEESAQDEGDHDEPDLATVVRRVPGAYRDRD